MFTPINSGILWSGHDMKRLNEVREILELNHIPYKHKVLNRLGEWTGERGTTRSRMGSIGTSTEQMYQYEVYVYTKDAERAKRLIAE